MSDFTNVKQEQKFVKFLCYFACFKEKKNTDAATSIQFFGISFTSTFLFVYLFTPIHLFRTTKITGVILAIHIIFQEKNDKL